MPCTIAGGAALESPQMPARAAARPDKKVPVSTPVANPTTGTLTGKGWDNWKAT